MATIFDFDAQTIAMTDVYVRCYWKLHNSSWGAADQTVRGKIQSTQRSGRQMGYI